MRISTYDVGSLPPPENEHKFQEGLRKYLKGESDEDSEYFERKIVESFIAKMKCGLEVPNYPQFRGMIETFLESMDGIRKMGEAYTLEAEPSTKSDMRILPEVRVIKENAGVILEEFEDIDKLQLKVCITGPYTLASFFPGWDEHIFEMLGKPVAQMVSENVCKTPKLRTEIVALDEPIFGEDDPRLDYGRRGREILLKTWDEIFNEAKKKGAITVLHLHKTTDELFWNLENVQVIESHVDDPLYSSERTRKMLEKTGKTVRASIAKTNFDELIGERKRSEGKSFEEVAGEIWVKIKRGEIKPEDFVEDLATMSKRLKRVIDFLGEERVTHAGPECGLRGFPTHESAMECLRRVVKATNLIRDS